MEKRKGQPGGKAGRKERTMRWFSRIHLLAMVAFVLLCTLTPGCHLFSPELEVRVLLPELPGTWTGFEENLSFKLLIPGEEEKKEITIQEDLAPGSSVSIILPKSPNYPLIARPCFSPASLPEGGMREAGGLYPAALKGGTFLLSWEEGPTARLLLDIWSDCPWVENINSLRIAETAAALTLASPWFLDRRKAARSFLYDRFYGGFLSEVELYPAALPDEAAEWVWGDPFLPPGPGDEAWGADETGEILLPEGYHRLIAPDGSAWYDLFIDEKGLQTMTSSQAAP